MKLIKVFNTKEEAEKYAQYLRNKMGHRLYQEKRDIDSYMNKARNKTKLMLRTETAKMANFGMTKAWEKDEDKDKYRYYWNTIKDNRTKKISLMRKQGNPYTLVEILYLWEHQKQLVDGKWQNDSFNQRCGISRGKFKLDYNWKKNRFLGKEYEFKETM